jgi:hypothetical protein
MKRKVPTTESVLEEQKARAKADREKVPAVKASSTALSADSSNPWIEISAELDRFIGAPYVRFNKQGEFCISDTETIPAGTRCTAHADDIVFGWRGWRGNRIFETRAGFVRDGYVPPRRADLGDTDESQWEKDDDGKPRDPWQFFGSVPLTRLDTGESYLFAASSRGGVRAINGLMRTYGSRLRAKGDAAAAGLPIVELRPDSYKHRLYGKIYVPTMIVASWTDASGKPLSTADDMDDDLPDNLKGKAA